MNKTYVLAFDTANEVIAIGVGRLDPTSRSVELVAAAEAEARRASNTQLLPRIDALLSECGVVRGEIACVAVGRGPGSFTGVRIAMATAKGVAEALGTPLVGVSSLDAVAWNAWAGGVRGPLAVVADAMRKEAYPVRYRLDDGGAMRLEADRVLKAEVAAESLTAGDGRADWDRTTPPARRGAPRACEGEDRSADAAEAGSDGSVVRTPAPRLRLAGDALKKYGELFAACGELLDASLWTPTGRGLLLALQAAWRAGTADPLDAARHDPAFALPVYTRLSDAEENERIRLAKNDPKNLASGVQDVAPGDARSEERRDRRATMHDTAIMNARPDDSGIVYKPLDAAHAADVAALEARVMGSDAWSEALVADELPRGDRSWWAAYAASGDCREPGTASASGAHAGGGGDEASGPARASAGNDPAAAASISAAGASAAATDSNVAGASVAASDLVEASAARTVSSGAPEARLDGLRLVGYAGGWIVDGQVQILKIGVDPSMRRRGIARALLARVAADARDLGAASCSLEVRLSNAGARALYEALGLRPLGIRPRYYSDGEDAVIMEGPLPLAPRDVAGMRLQVDAARSASVPRPASAGDPADASSRASADDLEGALRPAGAGDLGGADDPARTAADARAASCSAPASASGSACATPSPRLASASRIAAAEPSATRADVSRETAPACEGDPDAGAAALDRARPLILAIESSCDETAAAIVDGAGNLVADVVASQIDFHARFGGVVPEIASRKHIEAICGVCDECFDVASSHLGVSHLDWEDLDAVAVTYAPGLVGALVVGVAFAKGAAWAAGKPFVGVHHLEGHMYANRIGAPDFEPPAVVSLVSGGNTLLVHMKGWGDYETLGATIDDAVGEAFDKVAKALGLGYPGGPVISRAAVQGDPDAIPFPRAMMHSGDLRFSLSGLKTAVVTYINNERAAGRELDVPDIAASFQQAVVDVQVKKAEMALRQTGAPTFCLGGGVAANPALRSAYEQLCERMGVRLVMPPLSACGDNAGMIALVALDRFRQRRFFGLEADALAHADLDEPY